MFFLHPQIRVDDLLVGLDLLRRAGRNQLAEHLPGVGGPVKHVLRRFFGLFLNGETAGDAFDVAVDELVIFLDELRAFRRGIFFVERFELLEFFLRNLEVLLSERLALHIRGFKEDADLHGRQQQIALHGIEDGQFGNGVVRHALGNGAAFGHGLGRHVRDDAGEDKKKGETAADLLRQGQTHTSSTGYACRPTGGQAAFPGTRSLRRACVCRFAAAWEQGRTRMCRCPEKGKE